MKSVILIQNSKSTHSVLATFTQGLQQAFIRAGICCHTFDMMTQTEGEILAQFAGNFPDCSIGFNILPEHLSFQQLGIPHIALMVDHAPQHSTLLHSPDTFVGFMDEDSCEFFKMLGHPRVFFFPHAIDRELLAATSPSTRDLDVVMCGSFSDFGSIHDLWKEIFSPKAVTILEELAESVLSSNQRSHMQALVEEVERGGLLAQEIREKSIAGFELMNWLEIYIRGIDRVRLLQAIEDVDIHIFDSTGDWQKALQGKKRLFFHDAVTYDKLPAIFQRATFVINSMPTIKRGLHERLLLALSQGASVLTNDSIYLANTFPEGNALLYIRPPDYTSANERIAEALQDQKKRLSDVVEAKKIISEQHTFDVRVKLLSNLG